MEIPGAASRLAQEDEVGRRRHAGSIADAERSGDDEGGGGDDEESWVFFVSHGPFQLREGRSSEKEMPDSEEHVAGGASEHGQVCWHGGQ